MPLSGPNDWIDVFSARLRPAVAVEIRARVLGEQTPGFLLGRFNTDLRKFEVEGFDSGRAGAEAPRNVIGMYRSHTASGLQTNAEDAEMIARFFPSGPALLLLAKPLSREECVAACFRCADGTILEPGTSSEEFPLKAPSAAPHRPRIRTDWWLIPSAIAVGLAAAAWVHYTADRTDENPINSYSDTRSGAQAEKPAALPAASASTGIK
jgi:hypothetical protein